MYKHQINNMSRKVCESLGYDPVEDVEQFIKIQEALQGFWTDKIAVTWTTSDIHTAVKSACNSRPLTEIEAQEVLQQILEDADAQTGVNWETLFGAVRNYCHREGIPYK